MKALLVLVVGLGLPGFLPALAAARRSPVLIFLAPVTGALMLAVAAQIELGVGGSLVSDYVLVAVIANFAVIAWWLLAGRSRPPARRLWLRPSPPWYLVTVAAALVAMVFPLTGLRARNIGWDANSIWITHALMVSGGHHALLTGLQNPTYLFANPDYPPLVPAAGALAFTVFGRGDLYIAVNMTVLLIVCGLGVLAAGIAAIGATARALTTRIAALAAASAICLAGFAVAGVPGITGYADLAWAATAASAVVWGLVLPKSGQALAIAWISVAAATLTKNEGLTTALVIIVFIAFRYRPLTRLLTLRAWAERAVLVVVPALPGLISAAQARLIGLHDAFFKATSNETLATRASATIHGMAQHLAIAPVALALLIIGSVFLRRERTRAGLANPAWLWLSFLVGAGIIFYTYLIGGMGIVVWLRNSVNRTMVFSQLALYAEVAIWLVIAFEAFAPEAAKPDVAAPAAALVSRGGEHDFQRGGSAPGLSSAVRLDARPSELLD